jgi:hypothetical protein
MVQSIFKPNKSRRQILKVKTAHTYAHAIDAIRIDWNSESDSKDRISPYKRPLRHRGGVEV